MTPHTQAIIQRLEREVQPQADRTMRVLLQILHSIGNKSSVPETIFTAIGALANALERDFAPYMDAFAPFLYNALGSQDDPGLCSVAIGLVSDITRSLGELSQPYCDKFMNHLLDNLRVGFFWRLVMRSCLTSTDLGITPEYHPEQSVQTGYPSMFRGPRSSHRWTLRGVPFGRRASAATGG